ncbi:MAG: hypothetical protein HY020_25180 [Burkholderiales bacterium]|nr:hypothetical protein [Burkholderiales bacterium]
MHIQLATLAQASVLQLRDVLRRTTALHVHAAGERHAEKAPAAVKPGNLPCVEWQETDFDVRHIRA